jgi:CRISPR-associated protein Csd1
LLKLAQSHLSKLSNWNRNRYDKLLQEILSTLDEFPKALSLPRQGDFLLGYYQQKQKLYEKKNQQGENEL